MQVHDDLGRALTLPAHPRWLLGRPAQAHCLTDSLWAQLSQLAAGPTPLRRPNVLALAWADPRYVYGQNTLFTDEIRLASGLLATVLVVAIGSRRGRVQPAALLLGG